MNNLYCCPQWLSLLKLNKISCQDREWNLFRGYGNLLDNWHTHLQLCMNYFYTQYLIWFRSSGQWSGVVKWTMWHVQPMFVSIFMQKEKVTSFHPTSDYTVYKDNARPDDIHDSSTTCWQGLWHLVWEGPWTGCNSTFSTWRSLKLCSKWECGGWH